MNSTLYTFIKDVECTYLSDSFLLLILKAYAAFQANQFKGCEKNIALNDMPALNLFQNNWLRSILTSYKTVYLNMISFLQHEIPANVLANT